tara:strand:+ start:414 stop:671 length:258 start_codon:yes stop_codon:yes gene_type:complete
MQIKQLISKDIKNNVKRYIDISLEKYDNIYYQNKYSIFFKGQADILTELQDKVGLATAWFSNKYKVIDINTIKGQLRRIALNSKK